MLVLLGADTPTPTPTSTVDPDLVTPGAVGFFAVVVVVVAVILLVWDMNRRVRKVRYREEVREELDAEAAAADAGEPQTDAGAAEEPPVPGGSDGSDEENPPR